MYDPGDPRLLELPAGVQCADVTVTVDPSVQSILDEIREKTMALHARGLHPRYVVMSPRTYRILGRPGLNGLSVVVVAGVLSLTVVGTPDEEGWR